MTRTFAERRSDLDSILKGGSDQTANSLPFDQTIIAQNQLLRDEHEQARARVGQARARRRCTYPRMTIIVWRERSIHLRDLAQIKALDCIGLPIF